MDTRKRIALDALGAVVILTFGTVGYMLIEGWAPLDAFFMTITTVTTVGYGEVHPLSPAGQIFTGLLIIMGVGYFAYVFASITRIVVGGEVQEMLGRRKLEKRLKAQEGHYIICGFGRIGAVVAAELAARQVPFVVIESDPERLQRLDEGGYLYVAGSATEEATLERAGIAKAKGLISAVRSDADNVFIALTARGLNPDLYILSRAEDEVSLKKLLRAGADKVILPYHLGARRMAEAVSRPAVAEFIDLAVHGRSLELRMEEVTVAPQSRLVGQTLVDSEIKANLDLLVVAIRRSGGEMLFNPHPTEKIDGGDTLIVLGEQGNLKRLEEMALGAA
jgi:voltage-gated potassium channel